MSWRSSSHEPRGVNFVAALDGRVFLEREPDSSDEVSDHEDTDSDTTGMGSPEEEPAQLLEHSASKLKAQLSELMQQLGSLSMIFEDPQQYSVLGKFRIARAEALLGNISDAFDEARKPSRIYCEICMENLPREKFPQRAVTELCSHTTNACLDCLSQSITSQLEWKSWDQINCPTCPSKLQSGDVESFAHENTVTRYHRFMLASALASDPNFRNCLRPRCQSGQLHESGHSEPLMYCAECAFRMCFVHSMPWHEGQTCSEYDESIRLQGRRKKEEDDSAATIDRTSKPCPGEGCTSRIEKNDGCDHITCIRCRHEFCWQCLAPYGPIRTLGNTGHRASCPYHSDSLPPNAILNPSRYLRV